MDRSKLKFTLGHPNLLKLR